jgi:hypothetical protein
MTNNTVVRVAPCILVLHFASLCSAQVGTCTAKQLSGSALLGTCSVTCQTGQAAHCTDSNVPSPPSCTCGPVTGSVGPNDVSVTSCTATNLNDQKVEVEHCSVACPVGKASVCGNVGAKQPPVACECR